VKWRCVPLYVFETGVEENPDEVLAIQEADAEVGGGG
jgi:hypothetical protein